MTATLEHVVVIYLGWIQPRKSFVLAISSLQSLNIVMRLLRNAHPAPLHPIIVIGLFAKWGIDYMHCKSTSARGHGYIIVGVDYFTKWAEDMPTYAKDGNTATLFLFNHIIARFGVPQSIVTYHGSHFHNQMMDEMSAKLYFCHGNSTLYYPQANGKVEAINKVLKTMLHRIVGDHKSNWNHIIFSALWAYQTSMKIATSFTPF